LVIGALRLVGDRRVIFTGCRGTTFGDLLIDGAARIA